MKKISLSIYLVFSCILLLSGQDLGESMKTDAENFWTRSPDKLMAAFASPKLYKWESALKKNLVYSSGAAKPELSFLGHPLGRASFVFSSNKLQGMYLILAEGATPPDRKTYLKQVKSLEALIKGISDSKKPKISSYRAGNKHTFTYSWKSPQYYIALKCGYFRTPEQDFVPSNILISVFHRFSFNSAKVKNEPLPEKPNEETTAPDTKSEAQADEDGDHYLKVPMLKEKSPQDCVSVCMKRIFAFYKTAPRDRSWKKIYKCLELNEKSAKGLKNISGSIAGECRCEVEKIAETSIFDDFNSVNEFIKNYNRQAKKLKKPKLSPFKVNSFPKLLKAMQEDVLVAARNDPGKIANLKTRVCKEIDAGNPVLWVVFAGIVKEEPEVAAPGGRARLITGYNAKSDELIYSDNWGKGHQKKKISWDKAWAMTLSVLAIHPEN